MMSILARIMMALSLLAASTAATATPRVGEVAPDFTLTLLDGRTVSLSELRGEVVVLNFWATWCAPCRQELPILNGYYAMQKHQGLRVFAVLDQSEASIPPSRLKTYLGQLAMPSARRIAGPYAPMGALPTNYVIDRAGVVRYARTGAFDLNALNRLIMPLLREPIPSRAPAI